MMKKGIILFGLGEYDTDNESMKDTVIVIVSEVLLEVNQKPRLKLVGRLGFA